MNEAITHELSHEILEDVTEAIAALHSIRANLERETERIDRVISNIKRTQAIARVMEKGGNGIADCQSMDWATNHVIAGSLRNEN